MKGLDERIPCNGPRNRRDIGLCLDWGRINDISVNCSKIALNDQTTTEHIPFMDIAV